MADCPKDGKEPIHCVQRPGRECGTVFCGNQQVRSNAHAIAQGDVAISDAAPVQML